MRMLANRFDFLVISLSFLAFIVSHSIVKSIYFPNDAHAWRAVMILPILRVFSVIEKIRDTIFGVLDAMKSLAAVIGLLLIFLYVYGVVGIYLFYHTQQLLLPDDRPPGANFDRFRDAEISLYQVLKIGRAVQQECRDRSRMPSSA
eukprot:TRINITY_DN109226_c0_g1_i1.p1 TRINITY_DN109226_c0_g1~~TRINITY_DN109226_c0_g1_i1.p1  ORF type:complete len:146 (+),score=12.61 TRINITY_DN109226_c0_g1_i1:113-550(+)